MHFWEHHVYHWNFPRRLQIEDFEKLNELFLFDLGGVLSAERNGNVPEALHLIGGGDQDSFGNRGDISVSAAISV